MKIVWNDLVDKGFLIIRNFLTEAELNVLRKDYEKLNLPKRGEQDGPIIRGQPKVSQLISKYFEPKLTALSDEIERQTGLQSDVQTAGLFFSTKGGIDYIWHQDHESWFLFQEHYHYIHNYMPIYKPEAKLSNVSLIPFDALKQKSPEYYNVLVGRGAREFKVENGVTHVKDDETGEMFTMPFDIDELEFNPELGVGDLLLFRGDVIHRTQDTLTDRVTASFRRQSSQTLVNRQRIEKIAQSAAREAVIGKSATFQLTLDCFRYANKENMTVGEIVELAESGKLNA